MQAIVQLEYGSQDVLHLDEVPVPAIADDELLIQVHAAGLDRGTWHLMAGQPYLMRIMGFGFRRPRNYVAGRDVAGTVVEVGAAVTRFQVGDDVFGISEGAFAEFATVREAKLARKPANISFEQAAVVPISGITALQSLRDVGRVQPGQRVLIVGASGGVGTFAVQIAKVLGAEVTGVCSSAKVDLVMALGADHVIDYTKDDFARDPQRYDVILDIGGSTPLPRLRRALCPTGTLVLVGGENAGRLTGMSRQLGAVARSPFVSQRLAMKTPNENHLDIERLAELIASGDVSASLDRTYPLDQASDAMHYLVTGQARGKLAITLSAQAGLR